MKCVIPNKTKSIYPKASEEILSSPEALCCFCGCNLCLYKGETYYNEPVNLEEHLAKLRKIIELIDID